MKVSKGWVMGFAQERISRNGCNTYKTTTIDHMKMSFEIINLLTCKLPCALGVSQISCT